MESFNPQKGAAFLIAILLGSLIAGVIGVLIFYKNSGGKSNQVTYQADLTQAKDAKIKADFSAIQLSLEQYKAKNGVYPAELSELAQQQFISQLPKDPYTSNNYKYLSDTGDYTLTALLGNGEEYKVSHH